MTISELQKIANGFKWFKVCYYGKGSTPDGVSYNTDSQLLKTLDEFEVVKIEPSEDVGEELKIYIDVK